MDWKSLLEKRLFPPDKCLVCVLGNLSGSSGKPLRLVSLVEGQGEYALFMYSLGQATTQNPDELNLENTMTLDSSFKFNLASHSTGPNQALPVRFINNFDNIVVDLPQGPELSTLFQQIKMAKQVQSQNTAFGLPSTFSWIEKYTGVPSPAVTQQNPFQTDTFDPFLTRLTANSNVPLVQHQPTGQISASQSKDNTDSALKELPPLTKDLQMEYRKMEQCSFDENAEICLSDWQHVLLTQANVGDNCPVVQDNTVISGNIKQNASEVDFQSNVRGDFFKQMSVDVESQSARNKSGSNNNVPPLGSKVSEMLQKPTDGSREKIIKLLMSTREDEYTEIKKFRVFCGTWNTNGQAASEPVIEWLAPEGDHPPHIYAIGFQELDLSKNAYIFSESAKEYEWSQRVRLGLHPKARYKRLKLIRLVGMMLVVFAQEELCPHIYNLEAEHVGTGLMGMMGNKGGVAVRFEFHDTSLCFVNTHLAAHTEEYERRNQDFREINNRMNFTIKSTMDTLMISDHDIVFWLGDLNYRLSDIEYNTCKEMIANNQLQELMNYDQLNRQMSLKKVFLDYLEGRITFIPTYKYDPGTDTFDTSEKNRAPAWCDRILWRGHNIAQTCYRSHPKLKVSDHKPVSAVFDAGISFINRDRYKDTYKDVMQKMDRMENEFLPQVILDATEIKFDNVKFIKPQTQNITVKNTGQVPVEFEFIKKLDENHYCKPWLNVEPCKSVIKIGDSCTIQFEVYVNPSTAPQLNSGDDTIEDILVLHLEGGKDLFVTVCGSYLPSCFGSSVEALVNMFKPIRDVETALLIDLEHSTPSLPTSPGVVNTDRPLDVPKELWRLVDHLNIYGKETEDLFQTPGLHSEVQLIRDCLDTGTPSRLPGTIHSVGEALLLFLESLAEPVIPYKYYYKCLDCCSNYDYSRKVLAEIPTSHRNVLKYMCAFCRHLLKFSATNNLEAKFLSNLFGNLFLRRPIKHNSNTDVNQRKLEEQKKSAFVYNFLANEYDE